MDIRIFSENPHLVADIREMFQKNINVSEYLRKLTREDMNSADIIELAYDAQAGSYVAAMQDEVFRDRKKQYADAIAAVLGSFGPVQSVLEAGVGEATTLGYVAAPLDKSTRFYGFDISWSRIVCAHNWLRETGARPAELCVGDMLNIPFSDNSMDIVYTSHSVEPNGGKEREILSELLRVARKYVVLLEPSYEMANQDGRRRMDQHGYCRNLPAHIRELGYEIVEHRLFEHIINPLNPTALTVVAKKAENAPAPLSLYRCPVSGTALSRKHDLFFSEEALLGYPLAGGIPCLRSQNAIICSAMDEL